MYSRVVIIILFFLALPVTRAAENDMVFVPPGKYLGLYAKNKTALPGYFLDRYPVSNRQFKKFLTRHRRWRKENISSILADVHYLKGLEQGEADAAVVYVSWFSASAYCDSRGKRLPTVDEWEYAASLFKQGVDKKILEWYSHPQQGQPARLGTGMVNRLGIHDLHGLIWEWTYDFSNALITGESRGDSEINEVLFCGAGSNRANRLRDYPEFMRHAMRSSLKANFTLGHLGFRCARSK